MTTDRQTVHRLTTYEWTITPPLIHLPTGLRAPLDIKIINNSLPLRQIQQQFFLLILENNHRMHFSAMQLMLMQLK